MTKATLVGLAFVGVVASTMLAPGRAVADGRNGFRGNSHHHHHNRLHSVPPQRFAPHRFSHHGHHGHHGRGAPFGLVAPPLIVYSTPGYAQPAYAPPIYAPPPVYYPPPPPPAYLPPASAAPPPTDTVIEFPNGRYELRGDGITTPYRWVWIPNPPAAPPAEAAPDVAPKAGPARPEPAQHRDLYRWTDDAGVVHWTDRLEKVPEAYRPKVTKIVS